MAQGAYDIRLAHRDELPVILALQHRAFGRVAEEAGLDPQVLDPIKEDLRDLRRLFDSGTMFLVAVGPNADVLGSVRGWYSDGVLMVNRLVIESGWERRGIGMALMDVLEAQFPHASAFRLFTGAKSEAPLALYQKRGYNVVGMQDREHFVLAWLEKPGPEAV
ncbi:MAG TPA: GNAT family N-acetyltransferase [Coriobacteriia bacterium]|nr:GNAT family N-acetyltransferase [Coriobacteriia bacterium]